MVKIRMARGGAKRKPFYSIVATDSRKRRDSGYIERIGFFNPVARGQEVRLQLDEDRLAYWMSQGAQISDRVKQLVKEHKDPSIREKRVAVVEAKLATDAAKIAATEKAAADSAAKEAAKVVAAEEAESAKVVAAEEAEAAKVLAAEEAEAAKVVAAEAEAEETPAEEVSAEQPSEEAPAEDKAAE